MRTAVFGRLHSFQISNFNWPGLGPTEPFEEKNEKQTITKRKTQFFIQGLFEKHFDREGVLIGASG